MACSTLSQNVLISLYNPCLKMFASKLEDWNLGGELLYNSSRDTDTVFILSLLEALKSQNSEGC